MRHFHDFICIVSCYKLVRNEVGFAFALASAIGTRPRRKVGGGVEGEEVQQRATACRLSSFSLSKKGRRVFEREGGGVSFVVCSRACGRPVRNIGCLGCFGRAELSMTQPDR